MKTRFILTPIAAATMALGSSFAMATSHDAKPPIAETQSSVPQVTKQPQQQSGAQDPRVMGQQTTTDQQRSGTTGQTGATEQQTGTKAYGTDVEKDRMRTDKPATTGTRPAGQAPAPRVGTPPYGTDVDKDRMRQGTTGTGTPSASGTMAPGKDTARAPGTTNRTAAAQASTRSMDQNRASKIMGMDVVNRQGEKIGDVEDIVVDSRGNISHVVVSTGTFLAIGERLHAIPWNAINRDNDQKFVVDVDRDRLRNAPGFDRNNWPNMTDQQWKQQNQRYFSRTATGTAATTGQRDKTTGMQRGTTGATEQQTGTKAYGTDVEKDRMRTDKPATTGTQPAGQAPAPRVGTPPYGTDVDKDRMRQGTTGTGTTGTTGTTGSSATTGTKPYGTDVDKDRMRQGTTGTSGAAGTTPGK